MVVVIVVVLVVVVVAVVVLVVVVVAVVVLVIVVAVVAVVNQIVVVLVVVVVARSNLAKQAEHVVFFVKRFANLVLPIASSSNRDGSSAPALIGQLLSLRKGGPDSTEDG